MSSLLNRCRNILEREHQLLHPDVDKITVLLLIFLFSGCPIPIHSPPNITLTFLHWWNARKHSSYFNDVLNKLTPPGYANAGMLGLGMSGLPFANGDGLPVGMGMAMGGPWGLPYGMGMGYGMGATGMGVVGIGVVGIGMGKWDEANLPCSGGIIAFGAQQHSSRITIQIHIG